ncbi:MAG: hypothetical protein HY791_11280 [Deltaproteobacteria bacterium]|nr:hypothetical protein [Deltaproteobacteria bacterium]
MANEEDETSYVKEMLTSNTSTYGLLGALMTGAILSIPFGLGVGAIPLLGYAAAQGIASLFIPSSPEFRRKVDRKKKLERREAARRHLISEIELRAGRDAGRLWSTYHRMLERLRSLEKASSAGQIEISAEELDRLDDGTVKYLSLWLGGLVLDERRASLASSNLTSKLLEVDEQLENATSADERRRLEKAKSDLERIARRYDGLDARATALDAAMLVISDAFEEVHSQLMTQPAGVDVTAQLAEAVERMRVEEELDHAVEEELDELFRGKVASRSAQGVGQGMGQR